jgi:RhtB (resistance to homoserine/threonine) family protein
MPYEWTAFVIVTLLAVISPGADFAMVTRNALVSSRRAGVCTALGIAAGVLVHVTYAIMGIGLLISQSILAFTILKFVGAAYLVWLGLQMLKSGPATGDAISQPVALSDFRALKVGFLTNVLNPKTTLFVVSVYVQMVAPETELLTKIGCGAFMSMAHLVWFSLVALFFSTGSVRDRLIAVRHWIDRAFGAALTGLGLSLALSTAAARN